MADMEQGGRRHAVDVENGKAVMEGARDNAIPGIQADCASTCACPNGHPYVDQAWTRKLSGMDGMEHDMIDFAFAPDPGRSRVTRRIQVTDDIGGRVVQRPERPA